MLANNFVLWVYLSFIIRHMEEVNTNPMLELLKKIDIIKKEAGKIVKDKENPFFKS